MSKLIASVLALALLAGCATYHPSEEEWQTMVNDFVKSQQLESIKRITTFKLDSWYPLGEQNLILRTSPSRSYLLTLRGRCPDLDFAQALATDQSISSQLDAKFDAVFVPGKFHVRCPIDSIYPISKEQYKALTSWKSGKQEEAKPAAN